LDDLADDEERLFASQLIDTVSSWLASGTPSLEVQRAAPAYARLQEQILAGGHARLPPGVEPPGFFVDYSSSYAVGGGGGDDGGGGAGAGVPGLGLVLRRAAPGEAAAAAAARDAALAAGADSAAGFSVVFEAMRASSKPAVAHNLRFDLAFALQQFVGPLPAAWRDFKAAAGGLPGARAAGPGGPGAAGAAVRRRSLPPRAAQASRCLLRPRASGSNAIATQRRQQRNC
jgi:hypothetical protein